MVENNFRGMKPVGYTNLGMIRGLLWLTIRSDMRLSQDMSQDVTSCDPSSETVSLDNLTWLYHPP